MAKRSLSNPNNVEGNFFVDTRCIGCGACTYIAPDTFKIDDDLSYIQKQPNSKKKRTKATLALLSCPVFAIGMIEHRERIADVTAMMPWHLHEDVYFCGYNSRSSYGASSYFIQREHGNILIDSPRFDKDLVHALEIRGGLKYIYLTHKDDVADYQKFKKHFKAEVIFHEDDFCEQIPSADITLTGDKIWELDDEIKIIPQSGHTKGHTVLLYKDYYLFSGDHLAYNNKEDILYAFKDYCWYDWKTQVRSLHQLSDVSFSFLLPGHGRGHHTSAQHMKEMLQGYLSTLS